MIEKIWYFDRPRTNNNNNIKVLTVARQFCDWKKKRFIADLFWNLIHSKRIFIPFSHLRSPPCKVAVLYDINNQLRDARFDLCGICLFVHLPSFSNLFYLCSSVLNCLVSFSLYFSSFHSYFLSLYLQKNIIKFETNQIHFSL